MRCRIPGPQPIQPSRLNLCAATRHRSSRPQASLVCPSGSSKLETGKKSSKPPLLATHSPRPGGVFCRPVSVAIKVVKKPTTRHAATERLQMLRVEVDILRSIRHANIVQVAIPPKPSSPMSPHPTPPSTPLQYIPVYPTSHPIPSHPIPPSPAPSPSQLFPPHPIPALRGLRERVQALPRHGEGHGWGTL